MCVSGGLNTLTIRYVKFYVTCMNIQRKLLLFVITLSLQTNPASPHQKNTIMVNCTSSKLQPMFTPLVKWRHLAAVLIIAAAKEKVWSCGIKTETGIYAVVGCQDQQGLLC